MKNLKDILLIVLGFFASFLLFHYLNKKTELKQQSHLMSKIQYRENFYSLNFDINNEMTGLKALEISNLEWKNDTMLISKIMKTKPLLVFKYANSNCHSCYETYLNELKKIFEDFSSDVAVLCSYQTERDLLIFKQMNKITYPMYRIPTDAFNWKAEDYNNPYYFVLHPDMKISHIYIPDKAFPDMNRAYLESVKRLLTP